MPDDAAEEVDDDITDIDDVLPATQDETLPESSGTYSQKRMPLTREDSPVLEVRGSKRKRTGRKYTTMTTAQEVQLMEWYRDNELLCNKKLSSYRDKIRKTEMKENMAAKMGKTVDALENWMVNMRTRYAKLIDDKSGMAAREMTERDQWIHQSFEFLRPHIVRLPTRTSKDVVPAARHTKERSQTPAPVSAPAPVAARPGSASTSACADHADIDDPPPPPLDHEALQEKLYRALAMQQDLLEETQRPKKQTLAARLIRDAHTFAETYLANAPEDVARAYSLEVIKLATGFVDFGNKLTSYRPRVQLVPPMDQLAAHSMSFSPILQQQQQRQQQLQRSSWGGQTPSYGRPAATPVAERQALEDASSSFLRDVNIDMFPRDYNINPGQL